jgi:hypothetical protein
MALMGVTILFIAISDTSLLSPLLSAKIGSHCLCWWARFGSNQRPPLVSSVHPVRRRPHTSVAYRNRPRPASLSRARARRLLSALLHGDRRDHCTVAAQCPAYRRLVRHPLIAALNAALDLLFRTSVPVSIGRCWSAFDGPATAQKRPSSGRRTPLLGVEETEHPPEATGEDKQRQRDAHGEPQQHLAGDLDPRMGGIRLTTVAFWLHARMIHQRLSSANDG